MINENVIWPSPGRYILAVSGGADSMVLLDILARARVNRGYNLVVAHFDHGIRPNSHADLEFVSEAAARYELKFVSKRSVEILVSEAKARAARHSWLEYVRKDLDALAIITAHHQDDLIETSLLNLARGSGRLGLAPMSSLSTIKRPLLGIDRAMLRKIAAERDIAWREDPTNLDVSNPRNFLRLELLPVAQPDWSQRYLSLIKRLEALNTIIDQNVSEILFPFKISSDTFEFPRDFINDLDLPQLGEILLVASRALRPGIQLDQKVVQEVANFAKTGHSGKLRPLRQGLTLSMSRKSANLTTKSTH